MLRLGRSTTVWSNAMAVAIVAASATVAGAQTMGRPSKLPRAGVSSGKVEIAFGKCSTADKVMVTDLTLSPAAPKLGDKVTVALTARNLCDIAVDVPWQIFGPASLALGSGVQQKVPAGGSFVVNAIWTATEGAGGAYGAADPKNQLAEATANRANNGRQVQVTVESNVKRVEQMLSYQKAKDAGAGFAQNIGFGTIGCAWIGQFDPTRAETNGSSAPTPANQQNSVHFDARCPNVRGAGDPEAFMNFRLKNDWKIKDVTPGYARENAGISQWVVRPQEHSDNPYMKMHLETTGDPLLGGGYVTAFWKITIEGPDGTCPYKAIAGPCP